MHTFLTKHYETQPTYSWSVCPTVYKHSNLLLFSLCSPIPPGRCQAHILEHAMTHRPPDQLIILTIIHHHPAIIPCILYELDSRHTKWTNINAWTGERVETRWYCPPVKETKNVGLLAMSPYGLLGEIHSLINQTNISFGD